MSFGRKRLGRVFLLAALLIGMVGTVSALPEDSFEDQSFTDPDWSTVVKDSQGSVDIDSQYSFDGSYGAYADIPGEGDYYSDRSGFYASFDWSNVEDGTTFSTWFLQSVKYKNSYFYLAKTDPSGSTNDNLIGHTVDGGNNFRGCGQTNLDSYSYSGSTWYKNEIVITDKSAQQYSVNYYESDGTKVASCSDTWSGSASSTMYYHLGTMDGDDNARTYYDLSTYPKFNLKPSINSVSTSPSSWTVGSDVNVSADVVDGDGTVSSVSVDVWENGTQIVSDASLTQNSGTWEATDLFTVDESDVYYNISLTATDNDGATATYSDNQLIKDTAPNINIDKPVNKTYFTYETPVEVDVTDNDNVPGEDYSCTVDKDNSQVDSFKLKEGTNSTYTDTVDSDFGSHTLDVSCSDGSGNTGTANKIYTVDEFKFNSVTGSSNTFEKVNENFQVETTVGDMVEKIEYRLNYSNQYVDVKNVDYSNKTVLKSESNSLFHVTPFVGSDGTNKDYNVYANVSYKKLNGNSDYGSFTSSIQNQVVDQSFKFGNHSLVDGFTQLEGSTLSYTATVDEKTSNSLADVGNVETVWNQTGEEKSLDQGTGLNYINSFNTDLINSTQETFEVETNVSLSHNGDSRSFVDSKTVFLDKIRIESSSNSNNEETLKFVSQDEVNQSNVKSNLEIGLNVSNPDQPGKTRFYGFDVDGTSTHSFYLNPGYGTVNAKAFQENLITYQNSGKSYTKRNYYLLNEELDNQTTEVNLYMLKNSEGSSISFKVLDNDLRGLSNHIVRVERNFPSQEETRVVSMLKTDNQGQGKTFLNPGEQYIYTVFNSEGELVDQIGPQGITNLQTTLEVKDEVPEALSNQVNDVRFTDIQEKNQSVVVNYVSDTEKLNNITLTAREENTFSTNLLDTDSSDNLQGQLKVSGFNSSEQQVNYVLEGTFGGETVSLETGSFGTVDKGYGDTGIFMSLLMFVALTVTGLWRPSASIGLGVVGLFLMYFIGFISISQTALISVVVLGAVMVWRMS